MRVETTDTLFTQPVRDRRHLCASPSPTVTGDTPRIQTTLDRLEGDGRVVFRYAGGPGDADEWWSPNGSMRAIAGIVNDAGNVLGMMPHPERAVDSLLGSDDGLAVFESMLAARLTSGE